MQRAGSSACMPLQSPRRPPAREEAENLLPEQQRLLERLNLSTARAAARLEELLQVALRDSEASIPRSHVIVIRAPWGYGKTHYGKEVVPKIAEKLGMGYMYVTLENVIERLVDEARKLVQGGRLNYQEFEITLSSVARRALIDLFSEALERAKGRPAVLFIDEIEAVLEASQYQRSSSQLLRSLRSYIAQLLVNELLSAARMLLHSGASGPYASASGRLHLILATTPEAYNSIMTLAEKMGIGGRLARRIDVITLLPLSKLDTAKIVKALLEDYYGLPGDTWSPGIVNPVHVISGGNPGIVMRLVNSVIREAVIECRDIHGIDCVCSLNDPVLLTRLLARIELPYTPHGGLEQAVSKGIAELALREAAEGYTSLAEMIAYLSPLDLEAEESYSLMLAQHGVRLYPVRLYRGGCESVAALLDRAARVLADRAQVSVSDARRAVEELLYLESDGNCAIIVPVERRDYVEVGLLFSGHGVRVTVAVIADVLGVLEKEAIKAGLHGSEEMYAVKPSTLPILYPPAAVKAIPFVRDPEAAAKLYQELAELKSRMPMKYVELVVKGLQALLTGEEETAGPEVEITAYNTVYSVPAIIEYYEHGRRMYSTMVDKPDPEEPRVFIRLNVPPGSRLPPLLGPAWTSVDIGLTPRDAETLAALGYVLGEKRDEYEKLLDYAALRDLAQQYRSVIDERKPDLSSYYEQQGIAVPQSLLTPHGGGLGELVNAYRLLLFAADRHGVLDLDEAAELLYTGYRVRPYKGRSREWCGTKVPSVVLLDLEPNDHRAFYSAEKRAQYMHWLRGQLRSLAETAAANKLALRKEPDRYELTAHPVERRLARLIKEQGAGQEPSIVNLVRYFLLPKGSVQRENARRVLLALRDIYYARIEAKRRPRAEETMRLQRLASIARQMAAKSIGCISRGLDDNMYLAVLKERGAKLLELSTIAQTAEKLHDLAYKHSLVVEFADLFAHYVDLIEKALHKTDAMIREKRERVYDILRDAKSLIAKLRELGAKKVELGPVLQQSLNPDIVCKAVQQALDEAQRLHRLLATKTPEELTKRGLVDRNLVTALRFDSCTNPYYFAPLLYYLERRLRELREIEEAQSVVENLQRELSAIEDLLQELSQEAKPEAQRLIRKMLGTEPLIIDTDRYAVVRLQRLLDSLKKIKENYTHCLEIRQKISETTEHAEELLHEAMRTLQEARSLAERVAKLASLVKEEDIENSARNLESQIAELQDQIDDIDSTLTQLHGNAENTSCSNMERLQFLLHQVEALSKHARRHNEEAKKLQESVKNIAVTLGNRLLQQIQPLQNLAEKIEKLMEHVQDIKVRAQIQLALNDYQTAVNKLKLIATLHEAGRAEEIQEPPPKMLEEARQALDRAYHSLKEAITREIGVTGYRILEYLLENPLRQQTRLHKLVELLAQKLREPPEEILKALYIMDKRSYISLNIR